jgi:E3 ubiquitin-protein ligase DOA10
MSSSINPAVDNARPPSSDKAADEPTCRVCFGHSNGSSRKCATVEEEEESCLGRLVRVCACSGSIAFIHEGCLRRWLEVSSNPADRVNKEQTLLAS